MSTDGCPRALGSEGQPMLNEAFEERPLGSIICDIACASRWLMGDAGGAVR
jgi:hypothetical protein